MAPLFTFKIIKGTCILPRPWSMSSKQQARSLSVVIITEQQGPEQSSEASSSSSQVIRSASVKEAYLVVSDFHELFLAPNSPMQASKDALLNGIHASGFRHLVADCNHYGVLLRALKEDSVVSHKAARCKLASLVSVESALMSLQQRMDLVPAILATYVRLIPTADLQGINVPAGVREVMQEPVEQTAPPHAHIAAMPSQFAPRFNLSNNCRPSSHCNDLTTPQITPCMPQAYQRYQEVPLHAYQPQSPPQHIIPGTPAVSQQPPQNTQQQHVPAHQPTALLDAALVQPQVVQYAGAATSSSAHVGGAVLTPIALAQQPSSSAVPREFPQTLPGWTWAPTDLTSAYGLNEVLPNYISESASVISHEIQALRSFYQLPVQLQRHSNHARPVKNITWKGTWDTVDGFLGVMFRHHGVPAEHISLSLLDNPDNIITFFDLLVSLSCWQ